MASSPVSSTSMTSSKSKARSSTHSSIGSNSDGETPGNRHKLIGLICLVVALVGLGCVLYCACKDDPKKPKDKLVKPEENPEKPGETAEGPGDRLERPEEKPEKPGEKLENVVFTGLPPSSDIQSKFTTRADPYPVTANLQDELSSIEKEFQWIFAPYQKISETAKQDSNMTETKFKEMIKYFPMGHDESSAHGRNESADRFAEDVVKSGFLRAYNNRNGLPKRGADFEVTLNAVEYNITINKGDQSEPRVIINNNSDGRAIVVSPSSLFMGSTGKKTHKFLDDKDQLEEGESSGEKTEFGLNLPGKTEFVYLEMTKVRSPTRAPFYDNIPGENMSKGAPESRHTGDKNGQGQVCALSKSSYSDINIYKITVNLTYADGA